MSDESMRREETGWQTAPARNGRGIRGTTMTVRPRRLRAYAVSAGMLTIGCLAAVGPQPAVAHQLPPRVASDLRVTSTAPPAPKILRPAPGTVTDKFVTVEGLSSPNGRVAISGGIGPVTVFVPSDGRWQAGVPLSGEGAHQLRAVALDEAGTESEPTFVDVVLDSRPPEGRFGVEGLTGDGRTSNRTISLVPLVSDAGTGVTGVRFSDDGVTYGPWLPVGPAPWTLPDIDGRRVVYAQAKDGVEHVLTTSAVAILDRSAPRALGVFPAAGAQRAARGVSPHAKVSEQLLGRSVSRQSVRLYRTGSIRPVAATVTYDTADRTLSIDPRRRLKPGTRYTVVVTTLNSDFAGNALDQNPEKSGQQPRRWHFRTAAR